MIFDSILLRQTKALTLANLKTRYRNTWSGYLWVLLNPILIFGSQSYAFYYILKINIENHLLFLALGLLPWIFITSSTEMSAGILVNNRRLLKSLKISPLVFVFSQVIDNFINYISAFALILIPIAIVLTDHLFSFFLLVFPLISLFIFVCSLAFLCAQIQVFFRDLKFILNFLFQICFYITPIFYPRDFVPKSLAPILKFNFFAYILAPFQMLSKDFLYYDFAVKNAQAFLISILFLCASLILWRKKKNELYFNL